MKYRWKKRRNEYRILASTSERKRPLWRLRSKWEDNIKIDFGEISCEGVSCIKSNSEL
jgi:hypothetical protein